jgi:hypothetical protein
VVEHLPGICKALVQSLVPHTHTHTHTHTQIIKKGKPQGFTGLVFLHVILQAEMKEKVHTSSFFSFQEELKMAEFLDDQDTRLCDNW